MVTRASSLIRLDEARDFGAFSFPSGRLGRGFPMAVRRDREGPPCGPARADLLWLRPKASYYIWYIW